MHETATIQEYVYTKFEDAYVKLREKENRLYPDEDVRALPEVPSTNFYAQEWALRKRSSQRLISCLKRKKRALKILEIGCGNGWLSHSLSKIPGAQVTGNDINAIELEQAKRVFGSHVNLQFIYGDFTEIFTGEKFDIIVFAASIQYFPLLSEIVHSALQKLNSWGEVHIIDSIFYQAEELKQARVRSKEYFAKLGSSEMSRYYFHHCIDDLSKFNHSLFYDPNNPFRKFLSKKNPFHWVCIKPSE